MRPYKIDKDTFYQNGGFSNPNQFRRTSGGKWVYYAYPNR